MSASDRADGKEPSRPSDPEPSRPPGEELLTEWKGYRLSHFQIRAIEALRAEKNVLVAAPTGAGKTLVAEYAIEDAVRRGRRCVYTAPIKALSNQKYRDFRDDPDVDVGLMTGDVTIHPGAQVLIMTTEILRNAIFENPRSLEDIEYVVFDEVHFLDDYERGTVWEESLIFAPPRIRFICLSATIDNVEQLGAWIREIREQDLKVIRSDDRPVPLKHRFFYQPAGLFDVGKLERVRREAKSSGRGRPGRGRGHRGPDRGGRGGRGHGRFGRDRQGTGPPDPARLLKQLQREDLLPALVFSFSRRDCVRLALAYERENLLDAEEEERMDVLLEELLAGFQLDRGELWGEVFRLARRGIGYHHAGMLPIHKEVVERLFTSGLLKMLFTTETFALGINMPARTVVFNALRKFDGVQFDYMRTREYLQMAGRAGRQGIDSEGLVVSLLGDRDLREAPLERLIRGKPEAVESRFRLAYSSILHLVEGLGRERLHEAWEKSFNQFQHRGGSRKARERNQKRERRLLDAHLAFLEDLGYLDEDDRLTARGRLARSLYGYEIQLTEMLFAGVLENLPPEALAMIFVALIHEERRPGADPRVPARFYGGLRSRVDREVTALLAHESRFAIPSPMKMASWGLTEPTLAWVGGASFDELEELSEATPGDLCRTYRMAIQLMRQVRRSIDPSWDLADYLDEAIAAVNRDEVDARRQLELG